MAKHFSTLEKMIKDNDVIEGLIFNLDEIGVTPDKDLDGFCKRCRVFSCQETMELKNGEWAYMNRMTMMPVVSASGESGTPLFVLNDRIPYRNVIRNGGVYTEVRP